MEKLEHFPLFTFLFLLTQLIEFKQIYKGYTPTAPALENINLTIKPGEFVSIVGASGAGKSTLLKLLTAEEKPSQGEILLDNKRIDLLNLKQIPILRRQIGTIFQDFKLLPYRTVGENVAFALEVAGSSNKDIEQNVPMVLDVVKMKDKLDRYPHELSGGERQRVSIARALVHRPKIILADEPTGNLDLINTWEIIQLLVKINKLGTTVILATHDKDVVNSLKDRVITLDKGHLVRDQQKGRYII